MARKEPEITLEAPQRINERRERCAPVFPGVHDSSEQSKGVVAKVIFLFLLAADTRPATKARFTGDEFS